MQPVEATPNPVGLTPGKAALIAVLAIILAVVLVIQFGPGGDGGTPAPGAGTRGVAASRRLPRRPAPPAPSQPRLPAERSWPELLVSEIQQYNPFALPSSMRPAAPEPAGGAQEGGAEAAGDAEELAQQRRQRLAALQQQGVSLIFASGGRRVARVGDLELREGDVVDGFRVVAIRPDGVLLEAIPGSAPDPDG